MRGRFITVEGGEGVGKTLFTTGFAAALRALPVPLELGREPGGTPSAELIRSFWARSPESEPWLAMTELCLVSAARSQHVGVRIDRGGDATCLGVGIAVNDGGQG